MIGVFTQLTAHGEIMIGDSVEWLSADSSLVCFAQPLTVQRGQAPERHIRHIRVTFRVTERLYGPAEQNDSITVYDIAYFAKSQIDWEAAIATKESFLIFAQIARHQTDETEGRYIFTRLGDEISAFRKGMKLPDLFRPDAGVVAGYDEIVERCRRELVKRSDHESNYGTIERSSIEAPFKSEAHKKLFSGSWCGIFIPKYVTNKK